MIKWSFIVLAAALAFPPHCLADDSAPPKVIGEFLDWCTAHNQGCEDHIANIQFAMMVNVDVRFCRPKNADVNVDIKRVRAWLVGHAENRGSSTNDRIADGWRALHPCKS
jgi:hypothetical protein